MSKVLLSEAVDTSGFRSNFLICVAQRKFDLLRQVHSIVLNVLTDAREGKFIVDRGNTVDSGAAVTLANPEAIDHRRIVENTTEDVKPPIHIQGVGGKPVKITTKCSMYLFYTDSNGEHQKFILTNCCICNVVRAPLVSVSHLGSKRCEFT
jgi:hypothetical protein